MSSRRDPCPEALYGQHGEPNTTGNCPYCGVHLGRPWTGIPAKRQREILAAQDPLGIEPDLDEEYYGS